MRRFSLFFLMMTLALASFAQISEPYRYKCGSWKDNWEVSFGTEMNSFSGRTVSIGGCLNKNRLTAGVYASVGKWVSPFLLLRTEFDGIWAKYGYYGIRDKFFQLNEVAEVDLLNIIKGYKKDRFYSVLPYVGAGYFRNMTFDENNVCWTAGVDQTVRINDHLKASLGIGMGNGPGFNSARLMLRTGLSVAIGKQGWKVYKKKFRPYHGKKVVRYDRGKFDSKAFDYSYVRGIGIKVNREPLPEGMALVRRGFINLGLDEPDSTYMANASRKAVSVNDFWMDEKEVTNAKWRQFVEDVKKEVIERKISYTGDSTYAVESLYKVNPVTGERLLDVSQLNYVFHVYDYQEAMKEKYKAEGAFISKDTAWIDTDGTTHSMVINRKYSGEWDFVNSYVVNVYPDTTCWVNDYPNSSNGIFSRHYFNDGAYDNFPVVGVTWMQANAYCYWRTELLSRKAGKNIFSLEPFRLPTEAEFEYAARGLEGNEYPWAAEDSLKIRKFANFKNTDGNYVLDKNLITCEVGSYKPNSWKLYDMAGNVSEWTAEMYQELPHDMTSDINPEVRYSTEEKDAMPLKRKAVRGGSWKDEPKRLRSAWRTWEYQDKGRSYIGFRCVRSVATAVK